MLNIVRIISLVTLLGMSIWGFCLVFSWTPCPQTCNASSCRDFIPKDVVFDEVKEHLQKIGAHPVDGKLVDKDGKPIVFFHYTEWKGGMIPSPEWQARTRQQDAKNLEKLRESNSVIVYHPIRKKHEYLYP